MDKFVRIQKPIAKAQVHSKSKDAQKKTISQLTTISATLPIPKFNEWTDVIKEDTQSVDISKMSKADIEDVLRLFDLNMSYGPFVGIDRQDRWERANLRGLDPPLLVHRLIESGRALEQRKRGHLF